MPATTICTKAHALFAPLLAALLAVTLLGAPGVASAQEPAERAEFIEATESPESTEESAEARAARYYEEAAQAYQRGDFARAADLLESARAHHPDLVYAYNQVLAYQAMEHPAYALRLLDENTEAFERDGRFEDLVDLRGQLRRAIALRELAAREGSREAEHPASPTQPAPVEAPPEPAEDAPPILAWSLVGAGGAALGAGVLFGSGLLIEASVDRLERSRLPEAELAVYEGSGHTRADDLRRLRTHQTLNIVLLASGVSLGVAGATMLFLDARADRPHPHALRVAPMLTGEHAGALVRGRF
ncbi:hypothetical protein DV096_12335 [Bradymonadaceae bacterium TMQ3]|uniref:Tetratricopeptide repeat protein n=1 Tax=Lujinxingia sediminis TaxID=2480984 RepID=A0ABY0CRD1_9DELT|nr:hypothetical protein [Lujinxingia sediminis]RDV37891.1 hypothetical protein DV096_12335 [Bradymonadaceae bacterium TMQ3]RVU42779.1 hypothetical protein EA187_14815 [Lujinxingia sediminis]TXC75330.1 hypothetical protein FRC91_11445 [Bradymonadales bacterium TMQ1]